MKTIKPSVLLLLAFPIFFSSCQKSDEVEKISTCTITGYTTTSTSDQDIHGTFVYDDQFRIVKEAMFQNLTGNDSMYLDAITYSANKIIVVSGEKGSPDYKNDTTIYTVSNGKVISGVSADSASDGTYMYRHRRTYAYEYNSDGYLSKVTTTDHRSTSAPQDEPYDDIISVEYKYKDGNVISSESYYANHEPRSTETFEYYLDKLSVYAGLGINSFERFNNPNVKNLLKKRTEVFYGGNTDTEEYSYSYNVDGMPEKMTIKYDGGAVDNTTFTFSCK